MSPVKQDPVVASLAPENGWWKSHTETTLISVVGQLRDHGVSDDDIEDLLAHVIEAVREEYGD